LPAAIAAAREGRALIVPAGNGEEAAIASGVAVFEASSLLAVAAHLHGRTPLPRIERAPPRVDATECADLADVRGQFRARRALEIAAAGGHSLLFVGPPGTGKSMLAARLPGILPAMSDEEALEVAAVASISAGGFDAAQFGRRPFRAPHHTASGVALVGGGSQPRPGEISLAHQGVLFLDELPEFDRRVLEVLREPLESGRIVISRCPPGGIPGLLSAGRGHESLSLRLPRRSFRALPLHRGAGGALPGPHFRPAAGSHRHAGGSAAVAGAGAGAPARG